MISPCSSMNETWCGKRCYVPDLIIPVVSTFSHVLHRFHVSVLQVPAEAGCRSEVTLFVNALAMTCFRLTNAISLTFNYQSTASGRIYQSTMASDSAFTSNCNCHRHHRFRVKVTSKLSPSSDPFTCINSQCPSPSRKPIPQQRPPPR